MFGKINTWWFQLEGDSTDGLDWGILDNQTHEPRLKDLSCPKQPTTGTPFSSAIYSNSAKSVSETIAMGPETQAQPSAASRYTPNTLMTLTSKNPSTKTSILSPFIFPSAKSQPFNTFATYLSIPTLSVLPSDVTQSSIALNTKNHPKAEPTLGVTAASVRPSNFTVTRTATGCVNVVVDKVTLGTSISKDVREAGTKVN